MGIAKKFKVPPPCAKVIAIEKFTLERLCRNWLVSLAMTLSIV